MINILYFNCRQYTIHLSWNWQLLLWLQFCTYLLLYARYSNSNLHRGVTKGGRWGQLSENSLLDLNQGWPDNGSPYTVTCGPIVRAQPILDYTHTHLVSNMLGYTKYEGIAKEYTIFKTVKSKMTIVPVSSCGFPKKSVQLRLILVLWPDFALRYWHEEALVFWKIDK